ncbi:hypothetical protein HK098_003665 [Nowakowskiella sp. JEL0407]|nr:hypothetical protein HK098_003665 [Nowakowskiella sp. JEL0407]
MLHKMRFMSPTTDCVVLLLLFSYPVFAQPLFPSSAIDVVLKNDLFHYITFITTLSFLAISIILAGLESFLLSTEGPGSLGPTDGGVGDVNGVSYPQEKRYLGYRRGSNRTFIDTASLTRKSEESRSVPHIDNTVKGLSRWRQWTPNVGEYIIMLQCFVSYGILMGQRAPAFYRLFMADISWCMFIVPIDWFLRFAQTFRSGFNSAAVRSLQQNPRFFLKIAVDTPGPLFWSADWFSAALVCVIFLGVALQIYLLFGKLIVFIASKVKGKGSLSHEANRIYLDYFLAGNILFMACAFTPLTMSGFFQISLSLEDTVNPWWLKLTALLIVIFIIGLSFFFQSFLTRKSISYAEGLDGLLKAIAVENFKHQNGGNIWADRSAPPVPPLPSWVSRPSTLANSAKVAEADSDISDSSEPEVTVSSALDTLKKLNPRNNIVFSSWTHNLSPSGLSFLNNAFSRRLAICTCVSALPFCLQRVNAFTTASTIPNSTALSTGGISGGPIGVTMALGGVITGSSISLFVLMIMELMFLVYTINAIPKPINGIANYFAVIGTHGLYLLGSIFALVVVILKDIDSFSKSVVGQKIFALDLMMSVLMFLQVGYD